MVILLTCRDGWYFNRYTMTFEQWINNEQRQVLITRLEFDSKMSDNVNRYRVHTDTYKQMMINTMEIH